MLEDLLDARAILGGQLVVMHHAGGLHLPHDAVVLAAADFAALQEEHCAGAFNDAVTARALHNERLAAVVPGINHLDCGRDSARAYAARDAQPFQEYAHPIVQGRVDRRVNEGVLWQVD